MLTDRLEIRPPQEADRETFTDLFTDDAFMVFTEARTMQEAHARFDAMLSLFPEVPFAKQPLIERETGSIIGYAGVDWFDLDGKKALEFGYRLVSHTRGKGYATEAGHALLQLARRTFSDKIYLLVDPENSPSIRVAEKLGFSFVKNRVTGTEVQRLYQVDLG